MSSIPTAELKATRGRGLVGSSVFFPSQFFPLFCPLSSHTLTRTPHLQGSLQKVLRQPRGLKGRLHKTQGDAIARTRARNTAVAVTGSGVPQWLGSTRRGGAGQLIMRVSYGFISSTRTQAADTAYTVTLSL